MMRCCCAVLHGSAPSAKKIAPVARLAHAEKPTHGLLPETSAPGVVSAWTRKMPAMLR